MQRYQEAAKKAATASAPSLAPHVYQTAQMVHDVLRTGAPGTRSTIIISGESGAGKTESTKLILNYLVAIGGTTGEGAEGSNLRERVLSANPLLEAFGNAKTLRNDNSSRFGKLIELQFKVGSTNGIVGGSGVAPEVVGARIVNYLLEKTRLSKPPPGERNFHVLYQIVAPSSAASITPATLASIGFAAAGDDERPASLLEALPIGRPELLEYLGREGSWSAAEATAEADAFRKTAGCLAFLGVEREQRLELWSLLSAVLLLGNLSFSRVASADGGDGGGCAPADEHAQAKLAAMLGVSSSLLSSSLCRRKLSVRNQNVIHREQSEQQAHDARDALGRALYNGIFEWLVHQLNDTVKPGVGGPSDGAGGAGSSPPPSTLPLSSVGVLDIFGFEALEANSFEQLLINFANEKLQGLFNRHIFELEQTEYAREGIELSHVEWRDNHDALELIEARPGGVPGILGALDDATWRASEEDADAKLLDGLHAAFGGASGGAGSGTPSHPSYVRPKFGASWSFTLRHYAGDVTYDVRGFARKNLETLTPDVQELLHASTNPWLKHHRHFVLRTDPSLANPSQGTGGGKSGAGAQYMARSSSRLRQASVGEQFRTQLQELIHVIDTSTVARGGASGSGCAYVRCIKANGDKIPWKLDMDGCEHQLRCAGMMEAVRIRRQTFARRYALDDFLQSFRCLSGAANSASSHPTQLGRTSRADTLVSDAVDADDDGFETAEECDESSDGDVDAEEGEKAVDDLSEPSPGARTPTSGRRDRQRAEAAALLEAIASQLGEPESSWQCGRTKVFLRQPLSHRIEQWVSIVTGTARRIVGGAIDARRAYQRHVAAMALQRGWAFGRALSAGRKARLERRVLERATARWQAGVALIKHAAVVALAVKKLQRAARRRRHARATRKEVERIVAEKAAAEAAKSSGAEASMRRAFGSPLASPPPTPPRLLGPGQGSAPVFATAAARGSIRAFMDEKEESAPSVPPIVPGPAVMSLSQLPAGGLQQAVSAAAAAPASTLVKGGAASGGPPVSATGGGATTGEPQKPRSHGRTIEQLGPKRAVAVGAGDTVAMVAKAMIEARTEAVVILAESGAVQGILTATDIARRVVAQGHSPHETMARDVMTKDPRTVKTTDNADDALTAMLSGAFRHVPVVCPSGGPVALLDLVRCLFDVIQMLERAQAAGEALIDAVSRQASAAGMAIGVEGDDEARGVLSNALRSMLAPSVRSLAISGSKPPIVGKAETLQRAAATMLRPGATAVLVSDADADADADACEFRLLTPRSLLEVVATHAGVDGAPLAETPALSATSEDAPLLPAADCSVLDALHLLQAERRTHALVLAPSDGAQSTGGGEPAALLDILQLVRASVAHAERSSDAQQLHAFCGAQAQGGNINDSGAALSDHSQSTLESIPDTFVGGRTDVGGDSICPDDSISMAGVAFARGHHEGASRHQFGSSVGSPPPAAPSGPSVGRFGGMAPPPLEGGMTLGEGVVLFKLKDPSGSLHRVHVKPEDGWAALREEVQRRVSTSVTTLLYLDEDGDQVAIDSDESLLEAAAQARRAYGSHRLAVTAVGGGGLTLSNLDAPLPSTPRAASTPHAGAGANAASVGAAAASLGATTLHNARRDGPAVTSILGGLIAASSLAVGAGLVIAAKAAKR